jgi:hypothetical protein
MSAETPHYFDYLTPAKAAGITDEQLRIIKQMFRSDYPGDDMLYELHILRACNAIRDGFVTIQQVLAEARDRPASAA